MLPEEIHFVESHATQKCYPEKFGTFISMQIIPDGQIHFKNIASKCSNICKVCLTILRHHYTLKAKTRVQDLQ